MKSYVKELEDTVDELQKRLAESEKENKDIINDTLLCMKQLMDQKYKIGVTFLKPSYRFEDILYIHLSQRYMVYNNFCQIYRNFFKKLNSEIIYIERITCFGSKLRIWMHLNNNTISVDKFYHVLDYDNIEHPHFFNTYSRQILFKQYNSKIDMIKEVLRYFKSHRLI